MTTLDIPHQHHDWLRKAARAGYAARGLVYLIVGYFAFRAAYATGRAMGTKDAVDTVAGSAFGTVALVALVAALTCFTIWRLIQMFFDVDEHGLDARGVFARFGLIARGVTFFVLAGLLFTGAVSYGEGDTPGLEAALQAMSDWSYGWVLLSLTGLGLIAFGAYACVEALYRRIHIEKVG